MVGFFPTSSQYFIIGFEDLYGGGDGDYNDVLIVIDVGPGQRQDPPRRGHGTLPK